MDRGGFVAVAHVDISPRSSVDYGVELLEELAATTSAAGTVSIAVLRQPLRQNHLEIVAHFVNEEGYLRHLDDPSNRHFRREILPMLGSPYEDRLHAPRAGGLGATARGDFVALTQLELRPSALERGSGLVDRLVAEQRAAVGFREQLLLERDGRPGRVELLSTWEDETAFDAYAGSSTTVGVRRDLIEALVAPVEDRRHQLLAGDFAARVS